MLGELDLTRSANILQMKSLKKSGDDISIDREKLILSRISKAQKDAEKFVEEHPEFCYDDVLQDLICFVIKCTDRDIQSDRLMYGSSYQQRRDDYFDKLIKNQSSEEALINELSVYTNQDSTEDIVISSLTRDYILERIFKKMSKKQDKSERDIIIMLMHDMGFSYREIGKICNISPPSVGVIINGILKDAQRYANHKLNQK